MAWLFEQPSVVLVGVTLAAVLLVIELALPTLGLAGTLSFIAAAVAVGGLVRQDLEWWPLLGTAFAIVAWLVLLFGRRRSLPVEVATLGVVAASGVTFAVLNDDPASALVAAASAVAMAVAFPVIHRAFLRLTGRRAEVGMEAFVGRPALVDRWSGERGVVLLEGTRWNARGPAQLAAGDEVVVAQVAGSSLTVVRPGDVIDAPTGPPLIAPPGPPQG